jgi:hypothetical protein
MTILVMLLMTTAAPGANPVAQPPAASWASPGDEGPEAGGSHRRFSHRRGLFGRRAQGPQQQPGSAWGATPVGAVQPVPVPVSGAPLAAGPVAHPVTSQGPQQQPGCACGARPGGAGRLVPVPVSGAPTAAGPITPPRITSEPPMAVTAPPAPARPPQETPSAGPVTFPVSTAGPSPAMSRPEAATPPAPGAGPGLRRMPVGPGGAY